MKIRNKKLVAQWKKKRNGSGAIGYVFLFLVLLIMVILTLYLTQVTKLMTHQHHVDDSLADAVLASLVADDIYYFETYEETGTPIIRLKNVEESHDIFVDCMKDAIVGMDEFYYDFTFDTFICYEVKGTRIAITKYMGNAGIKQVSSGDVGTVTTPTGALVTETSAYGNVRFDIQNIINRSYITKSKDIYCTLEINNN